VLSDPSTGTQRHGFRTGTARKQDPGFREQIRSLLDSTDRRRKVLGGPVAVVLDEVQVILSVDEEGADWFLRDLMQPTPKVNFLCAHGSGLPIRPSSFHRVVEALRSPRILTDGAGKEEIDDPFFRAWILRNALPDSVPRDLLMEGGRTA